MNVLISGATGFIGRRMLEVLDQDDNIHHIYVLVHRNHGIKLKKPHTILKTEQLSQPCFYSIDKIIHLAQDPNYRAFPEKALSIFDCNIRLTQLLLDLAINSKVNQFIYFSSGSVYNLLNSPINENTEILAQDYYAFSKITSEQLCRLYEKFFKVSIFRLFNPYGPNLGDKFMTRIMNQIKENKPILVYPGKDFSLNPVHLDDICYATLNVLKKNLGGIYNLAGNEVTTFRELVSLMAKHLGKDITIQESTNANKLDMVALPEKLISHSQYKFTMRLEDGIRTFIKSHG